MPTGQCLILGGAGFMGSHLVELLVEEGFPVRVFDLPEAASRLRAGIAGKIDVEEGDFQDLERLARVVEGCEFVFHLIGTTRPASANRNPVFDVESNLVATVRLLEACVRAKVRQVLFPSSGGTVYGVAQSVPLPETHLTEPCTSYGITKLAVEKYLALFYRLHGLDYTVLRIANAYGPRGPLQGEQGAVGVFLSRLKRGEPLTLWGDGSVTRDYVYAGDVARAFRAALGQQSPFRVFNIGTGVGTSLVELIACMERVTGRPAALEKQPARPVDVPINVLDATRARQHLEWEPVTPLDTGLAHTWKWIQAVET